MAENQAHNDATRPNCHINCHTSCMFSNPKPADLLLPLGTHSQNFHSEGISVRLRFQPLSPKYYPWGIQSLHLSGKGNIGLKHYHNIFPLRNIIQPQQGKKFWHVITYMILQVFMLSEKSQSQKYKYYMIPLIWGGVVKIIETGRTAVVARAHGRTD